MIVILKKLFLISYLIQILKNLFLNDIKSFNFSFSQYKVVIFSTSSYRIYYYISISVRYFFFSLHSTIFLPYSLFLIIEHAFFLACMLFLYVQEVHHFCQAISYLNFYLLLGKLQKIKMRKNLAFLGYWEERRSDILSFEGQFRTSAIDELIS